MPRTLGGTLILFALMAALSSPPADAAAPPPVESGRVAPARDIFPDNVPRSLGDIHLLELRVQEVLKKVTPATVNFGGGSGVVVSPEGLMLTVAHVNRKSGLDISVTFADGKRVKGKTLGNYNSIDAGMARLAEPGTYPFAEVGRSKTLKVGQWVMVLGYPVSFTKGMAPPVRVGRILRLTPTTITTDCPMMGGDSGGPLFDLEGRVIGLNSRVGGGMTGNVHVPVDVYYDNWPKMLAGEDFGGKVMGSGKGKGKGKEKDKGKTDIADPETPSAQQPGKERPPFGKSRPPAPSERSHDSIKGVFAPALKPVAASTLRVLADGKDVALATVFDSAGNVVTKASRLKGKVSCRLPDGTVAEAALVGEDKETDLAVLRVNSKGLLPAAWRDGAVPARGNIVVAAGEKGAALAFGTVTVEPRKFNVAGAKSPAAMPTHGFLGVRIEPENGQGLKVTVTDGGPAAKGGMKTGDVIRKLGKADISTREKLTEVLTKTKPGDKVAVVVKRGEKEQTLEIELGKPTPTAAAPPYDRWGGGPFSERRFDFPKVLATDLVVHPDDCGGPLVDSSGKVAGVVISRSLRVATYSIPADDVRAAVKKILAAEKPDGTKRE